MILVSAIFFLILYVSISRAKRLPAISPLSIYFSIYCLFGFCVLLNQNLELFTYIPSTTSYVFVVISLFAVFLGGIIPLIRFQPNTRSILSVLVPQEIALKRVIGIFVFLLIVAMCWKIYKVYNAYGLSLLTGLQLRQDYVNNRFSFGISHPISLISGNMVFILSGIFIALYGLRHLRLRIILGFIFVVLNDFLVGGSYWIFQAIVIGFSGYIVTITSLNIRGVKQIFSVGPSLKILFLSFIVISSLITLRTGGNFSFENGFDFEVIAEKIVYYSAGNIFSFAYFYDNEISRPEIGFFLFGIFYRIFSFVTGTTLAEKYAFFDTNYDLFTAQIDNVSPYNTTIFLTYLISDFGPIGAIIVCALLAYFINTLYLKCIRSPQYGRIILVGMMLFAMIVGFRTTIVDGYSFWVIIALCLFLVKFGKSWAISIKPHAVRMRKVKNIPSL